MYKPISRLGSKPWMRIRIRMLTFGCRKMRIPKDAGKDFLVHGRLNPICKWKKETSANQNPEKLAEEKPFEPGKLLLHIYDIYSILQIQQMQKWLFLRWVRGGMKLKRNSITQMAAAKLVITTKRIIPVPVMFNAWDLDPVKKRPDMQPYTWEGSTCPY